MEVIQKKSTNRRLFIRQSTGLVWSAFYMPIPGKNTKEDFDRQKKPALPAELVYDFVRMAHSDLNKVKEMLGAEPGLVNACWDWGGGDFETALGGASHMGNRPIMEYLLQNGARKDIYCSAVLGEQDVIKALVAVDPSIVNVPGPHTLSLLYHIAIGGNTGIAEAVKPHLLKRSGQCNRALQVAAREGHLPMTEWLLSNGADDPNTTDFLGNTPLQIAEKKGFSAVAEALKKNGGS